MNKHIDATVKNNLLKYALQNCRLAVAFSGGPDSTALLKACVWLREVNLVKELMAIHINHQLRGAASDADESFCRELCKKLKVPFQSVTVNLGKKRAGVEERARAARIRAFEVLAEKGWKVCLAHTADDLVENFLLRVSRGTSPRGAAGMDIWNPPYFRPLLEVSRVDILEYLKKLRQRFRTDRSNKSVQFDRNFIRNVILTPLKKRRPKAYAAMYRFIRLLSEETKSLSKLVDDRLNERINNNVLDLNERSHFDELFLRQLITGFLARTCPESLNRLSGRKLADIERLVLRGDGGKRVDLSGLYAVEVVYGRIRIKRKRNKAIRMAAFDRNSQICWNGWILRNEEIALPSSLRASGKRDFYFLEPRSILFPVRVRSPRKNDRFAPFNLKGRHRNILRCLADRKINVFDRARLPILEDKRGIILAHPIDIDFSRRVRPKKSKKSKVIRVQILESLGNNC